MQIVGDLGVSCTISGFPFGEKSHSSLAVEAKQCRKMGELSARGDGKRTAFEGSVTVGYRHG